MRSKIGKKKVQEKDKKRTKLDCANCTFSVTGAKIEIKRPANGRNTMSEGYEDVVVDFEIGDDVMVTLNEEPEYLYGTILGYSEFLPGFFINVEGRMEDDEPLIEEEEQKVINETSALSFKQMISFLPVSHPVHECIYWMKQIAIVQGKHGVYREIDYDAIAQLDELGEFGDRLYSEASKVIIAKMNAERVGSKNFRVNKRPVKTFIPMDSVVQIELLEDALQELDLAEFAASIDTAVIETEKTEEGGNE